MMDKSKKVIRKNKKSHAGSIAILILSAAVLFYSVVFADSPARLVRSLQNIKIPFLLAGAGCMAIYWVFESASLHITAKKLYPAQKISDSIVVSMIGQLFNCITPFASGGQPVQAYQLVRRGMKLGLATSALLVKSIVYQVVLCVYSLMTLIFRYGLFSREISGFGSLVLLGFSVNTVVVILLCAVCCFPSAVGKSAQKLIWWLHHLHLIRDLHKTERALSKELGGFRQSFQILRGSLPLLLFLACLTAAQLTAFFMIPFFICTALGAADTNTFTIIAAGSFVMMISSFIPLPGASGGAEGSFYLFFHLFFQTSLMTRTAMLLWRVITFYLPIAVGSCFTAISSNADCSLPPADAEDNSVIFSQ